MAEPKTVDTLPGQCLLLIRLEGDEHIQEVGRFLRAPWRFGIGLGADFRPDPSGVMDIVYAPNDVLGVLPSGRMVHYTADEFELLMAAEGRA